MRNAWNVVTYLRSALPLTSKVVPVVSFEFVVFDDNPPDEALIEALVMAHVRNVELIASEVHFAPVHDDLLK